MYEQQKQAKREQLVATEARKKEEAEQAKYDLVKDDPVCETCLEMKAKIKEFRTERRLAAKAAGTWAAQSRDGQKKVEKAKKAAKEKELTAEQIEAKCIQRAERILTQFA